MTEDTFDCPLVELGLIEELESNGIYRFIRGPSLPFLISFFYMEYWIIGTCYYINKKLYHLKIFYTALQLWNCL